MDKPFKFCIPAVRRIVACTRTVNDNTHLLLMGDFNFPDIDWSNNSVIGSSNSLTSKFFDITQDLFLTQHIFQPT